CLYAPRCLSGPERARTAPWRKSLRDSSLAPPQGARENSTASPRPSRTCKAHCRRSTPARQDSQREPQRHKERIKNLCAFVVFCEKFHTTSQFSTKSFKMNSEFTCFYWHNRCTDNARKVGGSYGKKNKDIDSA